MDYAVSGNELAALSFYGGVAVPVGGDLPLEMGLRSPGRRWAGLSRFCLSELWRKRVSHPAGNQRSCHYPVQRGAVGTDVKSMIEKENDHGTVWI